MSRFVHPSILVVLATVLIAGIAGASAFTYQGKLENNGVGVDAGSARFVFRLYDSDTGGNLIGSPQTVYPVEVRAGIFTALVDFGDTAFGQERRWLEIEVDITGGTNFERLTPRQLVTASPVAQFALHGGDSPWQMNGVNTYFMQKVAIGTTNPSYPLEVTGTGVTRVIQGTSTDETGSRIGVQGESMSDVGTGVRGYARGRAGVNTGVLGISDSPDGRGVFGQNLQNTGGNPIGVLGQVLSSRGFGVRAENLATSDDAIALYAETSSPTGYAGYFRGRGYISGRLGIGTELPAAELDVNGVARMTGFQLHATPQAGYILTSDANGVGTWQAPTPGGGIGGSGTANYLPKFTGATSLGNSVIYESATGNIGIGTPAPGQKLHVLGTIRANGIQLPVNATAGYVLTTDAAGNGTWQEPTGSGGGFELPYTGAVTSSTPAFSITNHGTTASSSAIYAKIDAPGGSETGAAAEFDARGSLGRAIVARSDYQNAIFVSYSGTGASAISCYSSGSGGASISCSKLGGYGVKGWASDTGTSTSSRGGWFGSNSPSGVGVLAEADGDDATAAHARSEGSDAKALYAETTGDNAQSVLALATGLSGVAVKAVANSSAAVGLVASGGYKSAQFYGNVEIYEHGTTNKVIELGKGLDYAEGFDVVDGEDSISPGTVLVIDPDQPGQLACSRRPYDTKVAGIVAGANKLGSGVRLGAGQFDHDVALAGRVYCNVIALDEGIQPGDLLTTSSVPGYAMEAHDADRSRGAILGKAMEPLAKGTKGQILVLVTLQ